MKCWDVAHLSQKVVKHKVGQNTSETLPRNLRATIFENFDGRRFAEDGRGGIPMCFVRNALAIFWGEGCGIRGQCTICFDSKFYEKPLLISSLNDVAAAVKKPTSPQKF